MWRSTVSLTMEYMMMRRYCELKHVHVPHSHHNFHKKCRLAYIDPKKHWPCRKSHPHLCPMNVKTLTKKHQAVQSSITKIWQDWSLPRQWLAQDMIGHMPTIPAGMKGEVNCWLHQWAYGERIRQNEKWCGVNICHHCWEIFIPCHISPKTSVLFYLSHK